MIFSIDGSSNSKLPPTSNTISSHKSPNPVITEVGVPPCLMTPIISILSPLVPSISEGVISAFMLYLPWFIPSAAVIGDSFEYYVPMFDMI